MTMKLLVVIGFLTVVGCNVPALAQVDSVLRHDPSNSLKAANPQMSRLAACLAGDWDSVETMERSSFFPQGGSRKGKIHARLASGGYTLLYKVHSNGSAGELDGFHVIWWDPKARVYRFFACFNDAGEPCMDRGTAQWEGESFVNNYYFEAGGKHIRGRDTFTFTPTTHTLVAEIESERNGKLTTLITTRAKRQ
ncbi:MAG TPA: hypothetical protein VN708_26025 [Terriglobales bacterium]|jgi:hypothetical protein|nr:hypothetical protein [Terriglobales bacterium]